MTEPGGNDAGDYEHAGGCDEVMIRRGDVYDADLSPVVGSEQGGVRPVVVVQNDEKVTAIQKQLLLLLFQKDVKTRQFPHTSYLVMIH